MASFVVGLRRFLGALALMLLAHQAAAAERPAFVGESGSKLVVNGSPFVFNGFNAYWLMNVASEDQDEGLQDPERRGGGRAHRVPNVGVQRRRQPLAAVVAGGLQRESLPGASCLRFLPVSQRRRQAFVWRPQSILGLDFVVSEARNHGIRLVLSLINNFKDYGGRTQYVQWARDAGESIQTDDDFYTNAKVKQYYKNHVLKVLTRVNTITKVAYKDDPTIMTWDLMNEPRCQVDRTGQTVTVRTLSLASITAGNAAAAFISVNAWVKEMAAYTKSIDSKHLLQVIGKPLVFEEFGKSKTTPGYSQKVRDDFFSFVYGVIYSDAESSGGSFSGGLLWQIMGDGMDSYYDGFAIVLSRDSTTRAVIKNQSDAMAALKNRLSGSHH
ncbi:hypothetical protein C4D60_Mb06t13310 [Musa balbisiana]|uniref:mannan endo-1,4-beta-mannosidase n=1 Tax=Musa balbisiana TaxID=52838 RepID=A0A4S8IMP0_MUSBA|nr:hypothetical protein C4D60_Mb06t13310 [Musa balbisiana]